MQPTAPWRYRVPYWLLFLTLVGGLFLLSLLIPDGPVAPVFRTQDDKEATTIYLGQINQLCGLIASINTPLFAGAAAIAVNGKSWNPRWNEFDATVLLILLCSAATVYYGLYLGYAVLLEMTANRVVDPFQSRLDLALAIQYNALMLAFVLLGVLVCRILEHSRPEKTP